MYLLVLELDWRRVCANVYVYARCMSACVPVCVYVCMCRLGVGCVHIFLYICMWTHVKVTYGYICITVCPEGLHSCVRVCVRARA